MSGARLAILKAQRVNAKRMLTNFKKFIDSFVVEMDFPILEKILNEIEKQGNHSLKKSFGHPGAICNIGG